MKKFFSALVLIAIVAGAYYGLEILRGQKEEVQKVEIVRPVKTVIINSSSNGGVWRYYGTLQGGRRVDLSFRVSGPLRTIRVDKGASVRQGELLATLDPRDYRTRLRQAQSAQAQAKAQYDNAAANFKRYENLYKERVIPKATYDTYKTQMDVAKSALDAAAASTASVHDSVRDTELRAPFNGVIVDRMVENFQDVTAKQPIFSLQDISTLDIVFNVPDTDVIWASKAAAIKGNRVTLRAIFDALPGRVFPLEIKEIVMQADRSTNTFPVTAVMPSQEGLALLPGMSATVEVELHEDSKVKADNMPYIVPETALINENGKNFVWCCENNQVHKVQVAAGLPLNNGSIEISGRGLKDGDYIVTAGASLLHEGQKVRLIAGRK